ncbi:unnamed protein product, partial [Urochloa humidicola]
LGGLGSSFSRAAPPSAPPLPCRATRRREWSAPESVRATRRREDPAIAAHCPDAAEDREGRHSWGPHRRRGGRRKKGLGCLRGEEGAAAGVLIGRSPSTLSQVQNLTMAQLSENKIPQVGLRFKSPDEAWLFWVA